MHSTPSRAVALTALAVAGLLTALASCSSAPTLEESVSLTVYSSSSEYDPTGSSQGYGVVREVRKVPMSAGVNELRYTDIASGIDASSVTFHSLSAPETTVLEQNYEFDLADANTLLNRYLEHTITAVRADGQRLEGKLLQQDTSGLLLEVPGEPDPVQILTRDPESVARILLPELPAGLLTRPTLVWRVDSPLAATHWVEVAYQTAGLGWAADYQVVLDEASQTFDLLAWVTLNNNSGASFEGAHLKLVAGDVNRVQPSDDFEDVTVSQSELMLSKSAEVAPFEEKAFFEYHLYTLGHPTDLPNASTKQVELFLPVRGLPTKLRYLFDSVGAPLNFGSAPAFGASLYASTSGPVAVALQISNREKDGLGLALPAGRIRVQYREDPDSAAIPVGEGWIDHSPKEEDLELRVGTAFDLAGVRTQTGYTEFTRDHRLVESFEIELSNQKSEAVTIEVLEPLYRWSNWHVLKSSHPFEKKDAQHILIPVEVAAGATTKLTYSVEYSW